VFVWVGYLLGGLARIGYALATSWAFLVPFRVLDRSGKIRSTPRDAMVADLTTSADRGRRFGFLRLMDNTGAVIGVLVSIVLVGLVPMRTLFLLAALPSFAAVLLVWWRVREPAVTALHHPHLHLRDLKPNLWRFLFASACFELAAFSYSFLLLAAGAHGVSVLSLPWLYLLFTLSAAVVSLPAGWLVDRYGRRPLVQVALGVWLLLCLLFVFSHSMWALALGFILYGVHKGILDPAQKTLLTELAPREFRASVLGSFQLMVGTCSLLASLIAGLLWDAQGPQAPFLLSGGLTLVALLLMMRVTEERQHTSF
jgi:MFS family permease